MKKFLSILMILTLALSMGTMAFAEGETYKLTISDAQGHTYEVYQIFTGSLATIDGKETLGDVTYGANYTPGDAIAGVTKVPAADLEAITNAKTFAEELVNNNLLKGNALQSVTAAGETAVFEGLVPGYYVVLDVTKNLPEGEAPSAIIVQVVGDATIASKHGTVEIEKKVDDKNDSNTTEDGEEWIDSADYDIGDTVPFKSESTFDGLNKYTTYEVCFTDIMSPGLDYNKDLKIFIGETDVTEHFTIDDKDFASTNTNEAAYNGGTKITATCTDIKKIAAVGTNESVTFTLKYTAMLNEQAKIGAPGNPNKINVKGNPDGRGEFETPWDVAIVFTFKADVNKVDQNQAPLTGAEFALEKFIANTNGTETYKNVKGNWTALTLVINDVGTVFSFTGLDDGEYRISETVTPAGYNTVDPIYFTVTAEHTVEAANPELENLQATVVKSDGSAYTKEEIENGNIASFTVTKDDGEVSTTVVNNKGVELPETGGVGTTLFYIFGGCLVLGAIVLLITKKRMKNAEE